MRGRVLEHDRLGRQKGELVPVTACGRTPPGLMRFPEWARRERGALPDWTVYRASTANIRKSNADWLEGVSSTVR